MATSSTGLIDSRISSSQRNRSRQFATPDQHAKRADAKKSSTGTKHEYCDGPIEYIHNDAFKTIDPMVAEEKLDPLLEQIEQGELLANRSDGSGLPSHLARLCETPLLSPEEETQLFRRMNFCKYKANRLQAEPGVTSNQLASANEYLGRANLIRNYLIQANTRLVMSIARKFSDPKNHFDDLLSQGIASLMHAVEKFDFARGYRFSTYATCAVRRDLYRMVMGRKKDLQRYSSGLGEVLEACPDPGEALQPSDIADWNRLSRGVKKMLEHLDERERFIVINRFGLNKPDSQSASKKQSYSQLGKSLGISKERVRQLANRAMDKLRDTAQDLKLDLLLAN